MPKPLTFRLSTDDLQKIAKAIKYDKRPEVRRRAMGLRLLHEGQSPKKVGDMYSVFGQPNGYACK
jgi:hypothetical protein